MQRNFSEEDLFAEAAALTAEAGLDGGDEEDALLDDIDDFDDEIAQEDAAEEFEEELHRRAVEEKKAKKQRKEELFGPSVDDIFGGGDADEEENPDDEIDAMLHPTKRRKQGPRRKRGKKRTKMPPHMAALVGEANLAFANGEDAKALEYLLRVVQECPEAPDPFMTIGLIYEDRKQPEQAIEYLMIAAHLLGRDASLWKRCANMWRDLNDERRALYCYNKAIKFYESKPGMSHDFDSMWQRIQLYKGLGEYRKCGDALSSLLKLRPNDPDAIKELTRVYHMSEQLDKAEKLLQDQFDRMKTAVEAKDPTVVIDLDIINMLAEIQISAHHFDDASNTIHWAQTHFHETPESPFPMDLTANYGLSQLFLGKKISAQQTFEKLLVADPAEYYDLFWAVAAAYAEMEDHKSALKFWLPLLDYEGTNTAALWVLIARSYRAAGELRRAAEFFEKVFESLHDAESCCALTEIYSELSQLNSGIELVGRFLQWRQQQRVREEQGELIQAPLTDEEIRVTARMAKFYFQIGQYETFVEIVRPVVIDPELRFRRRRRRSKHKKINEDDEGPQDPEAEIVIPDALPGSDRQNILEIIGVDEYLYLVVATTRALIWLHREVEAQQLMSVCYVYIMYEGQDYIIPKETQRQLRYFAAQVALRAGDHARADRHLRLLILKEPFNTAFWNHFFIASQRLGLHLISGRFAMRLADKNPECLAARMMVGHFHHLSRSHRVALAEYLPAYIRYPNNPTVTLSIGLAYLNHAMSRTLGDRNYTVMQAFAFLFRYGDLTGWTQEALYNLGRAFHHLDLLPFAIHMYERALQASPIREMRLNALMRARNNHMHIDAMDVDQGSDPDDLDPVELEKLQSEDLSREIGHNLSLIYIRSGSPHLARMVLSQHVVI